MSRGGAETGEVGKQKEQEELGKRWWHNEGDMEPEDEQKQEKWGSRKSRRSRGG